MAAATDAMPATPDAYTDTFDLENIEIAGHFSRVGPNGQRIAFNDSKIRYCKLHVDENNTAPGSHRGPFWHNLIRGFEQFTPRQDAGNRTDPLCEWAVGISTSENSLPLSQVTMGSEVMTDRTTLMKIATTPYVEHRYGWKLDAFRIGNTLLLCPHAIEEEQQHYDGESGLKGVFRLQALKNIITEDGNGFGQPIYAAHSYHRVMTAILTDGTSGLKLLYACQVDCVNKETDSAVEIRTNEKRLRPKDMLSKMLKWYVSSRLSGARQMLIGVRTPDNHLEGIEQLPTSFMREFAEAEHSWNAQTSFAFLYAVLARARNLLERKGNGHRLTVSYSPTDKMVRFTSHENFGPHELFVSQKFWQKFAL